MSRLSIFQFESLKPALRTSTNIESPNKSLITQSQKTTPDLTPRYDYETINVFSKASRKVHFSTTVRVCLIPCRPEFNQIKHEIWWNAEELDTIKQESYFEVFQFMSNYGCDVKSALLVLYQNDCSSIKESHQVEASKHIDFQKLVELKTQKGFES